MRKDQKGFTLVELLIAVAIMSIVLAAVCGFIVVGSKSYAAANSDINVQQEAQLALNQMSDVMIDTTRSVNYAGYDSSGSPTLVVKDSEFTFEPTGKSLTLYNGTSVKQADGSELVEEGNGNKNYQFYWDKTDEVLWYTEQAITQNTFPALGDPAWEVLADHVTDFSIDLTQVEEKRVVQIAMTLEYGGKVYTTSNNVTIRNKVAINDAEIKSLDRSKTLSVATKDNGIIIEPGETFHFSVPIVTGTNVTDKSVTWSMDPAYSGHSQLIDTANGILQIANDEPAGTIKVWITTNAVDSEGRHATVDVPVNIKRVTEVKLAKTEDSNATNGALEISPGCTFTISATVDGNRLGSTCSVCGDDTTIDKQVGHNGTAYPWLIHDPSAVPGATTQWNPNKYIKMIESAPDHATFVFGPDENGKYPTSDEVTNYTVVIQAASLLSVTDNPASGRHYDPVFGAIELRMVKGKQQELFLDGSIKWGKKVGFTGKYPDDFNKGGQGYFLIFARIKEDLNAPASEDKIMAYTSHGMDSALTPDLFGVQDISKPWYVSLQVLDPQQHFQSGVGPSEQLLNDLNNQIWDRRVLDVIDDYLANCDSSGTYTGTKYPCTEKMSAIIQPPEIFYKYNGRENLSGELTLNPAYAARGGAEINMSVHYVKNTRGEVDGGDYNARYVKFKVYKEDKNGNWGKPFFEYVQEDPHSHDLSAGGSWHGTQDDGHINWDITSATNMWIKLDQNKNPMEAIGKYHIVPIIKYVQDPGADSSYSVYYANYQPNYWNVQTYDVPQSTIHFEVKGGNITLKNVYDQNGNYDGEGYFTIPTDTGWNEFSTLFELGNTNWHSAKLPSWGYSINLTQVGNSSQKRSLSILDIKCRYVTKEDAYEIEIFYGGEWIWTPETGSVQKKYSAGKFKCKADGNTWEQISAGYPVTD